MLFRSVDGCHRKLKDQNSALGEIYDPYVQSESWLEFYPSGFLINGFLIVFSGCKMPGML